MAVERRMKIIIALITVGIPAIGVLVVGYWQYVYKPVPPNNETMPYSVRVTNKDTRQGISGAKVTIEAKGIPPTPYTDSNGLSPFTLDKSIENAHVIVEAANCGTFDAHVPLPKIGSNVIDVRLQCSEPKTGSKGPVGPLGLTYEHNPTVDEVISDIRRVRSVDIRYRGKCRQSVGRAVIMLNGAQLNGIDAKDLLENNAKPRTNVQFSVVINQEGASYEIVCGK